ncbi:MAG TPA: hypothetical protein VGO52_26125 [Hyphomonadaceae bacterium]|jgi:hypothetical protein|nr:hypothetical protein [Hyphomonadaceae bacterium]
MRLRHALPAVALALTMALPTLAQKPAPKAAEPNWLARCNRQLNAGNNDPETGNYIYFTRGKDAGAAARSEFDYKASNSARNSIYPTEAKDLLNPFGSPSISMGYYATGDAAPTIGHISFGSSAKDFKPIPGTPIQIKLVLDGKTFGPYAPKESGNTDGMYSVWFDTADTDGDSKPPLLKPKEFAALAKAVDAMTASEVVLVQNGVDIVRTPITPTKRVMGRDGLAPWAKSVGRSDGITCLDKIVN